MRVSFETYKIVYKGKDKEHDLPIFERVDIKRVEGEIVDTQMITWPNGLGDMRLKPCFVVALDDLSFTYVPIDECTRVEDL